MVSYRVRRGAALIAFLSIAAASAIGGPVAAQGLFGVSQGADPALYSINTANGAIAEVGSGLPSGLQVSALTADGTSLLAGTLSGTLFLINPADGTVTPFGDTGNGNPLYGLAFLSGSLYGLQQSATDPGMEDLYQIGPGGSGETALGQVNDTSLLAGRGLAVDGGSLVTADAGLGAGGYLFSLNPTNGMETSLDTTGGTSPGLPLNGLDSLAALNGVLYGSNNDPSTPDYGIYKIDPGTAGVSVAAANLNGPRFGAIGTALPAVPEPGALWLLTPGLVLLAVTCRRRGRPVGVSAVLAALALLPGAVHAQAGNFSYPPTTSPTLLPPPPNNPQASATQNPLNTGKGLTLPPLGTQTNVASLPFNLVLSPDGKYAVSSDVGFREFLIAVRTADGTVASSLGFNGKNSITGAQEGLYYGLVFSPVKNADGSYTLYAAQGNENTIAVLTMDGNGVLTDPGTRFHGNTPASSLNATVGVTPVDTPSGMALDARGYLYVANNDPALPTLSASVSVYNVGGDPTRPLYTEEGRYTFPFSAFGPTNYPFSITAFPDGSKVFVGSERDGRVYVLSANLPPIPTVLPNGATAATPQLIGLIPTGSHPLGLTLSADDTKLYVANAQSDTVSVVNTATDAVTATVLLRPAGALGLPGVTPDNLALAPDGKTLYATLADMNAVAVIDTGRNRLLGYVPVGWYPTAVVISPDNQRLLVANGKGNYTRYPNPTYGQSLAASNGISTYNENMIEGDIQTIPIPSPAVLARETQTTLVNNRITPLTDNPPSNPLANIGLQAGKIKHVLYIVKENRTYDQILGDLTDVNGNPLGNGDASLDLDTPANFITPNLHALAQRFVLLDNYYEGGEVSEDGWNWSTQGMANEFTVRNVPYNYSGRQDFTQTDFQGQNNGYPVGGFPAMDVDGKLNSALFPTGAPAIPDIAQTPGGYVWDDAQKGGLSYRNYGVDLSTGAPGLIPDNYPTHANQHPEGHDLAGKSDYDFRRFDTDYPDSEAPYFYAYGSFPALPSAGQPYAAPGAVQDMNALFNETHYGKYNAPSRFSEFKREFNEMLAQGTTTQPDKGVPSFITMTLMSDHTQGANVGGANNPRIHSPKSMIADDDYGVGQMVDLISRSPIWNSTAIFVIEDDSQDGPDHVDCHRSICYVISPWIKQGAVDHAFYNTDSVLRTMEDLLGLPAMNQYDAVAAPILDWDTVPTNSTPYSAILPAKNIIADLNPTMLVLRKMDHRSAQYRLAMLARKMDFKHPDAAPEGLLNAMIWKSIKGWDAPVPGTVHGLPGTAPARSEAKPGDGDDAR